MQAFPALISGQIPCCGPSLCRPTDLPTCPHAHLTHPWTDDLVRIRSSIDPISSQQNYDPPPHLDFNSACSAGTGPNQTQGSAAASLLGLGPVPGCVTQGAKKGQKIVPQICFGCFKSVH